MGGDCELPQRKSSGVLSSFDPLMNSSMPKSPPTTIEVQKAFRLPDAVAAAFKNPPESEAGGCEGKEEDRLPSGVSVVEHEMLMQLVKNSTSKLRAPGVPDASNTNDDPFAELEA